MLIESIIVPFVAVALAELGDKTQLAVLCLASQTKKDLELLVGVVLGFAVTDGIAILLGNYITNILPLSYIRAGSGILFIVFGVLMLLKKKGENGDSCELKNPFFSGFSLILISEMGDKTQIASALFATQYDAFSVFVGVMAALFMLSAMAVYLGKIIVKKIDPLKVSKIGGFVFVAIGIFCLV